MIGTLLGGFFNLIFLLLGTLVQIIMLPLNSLFSNIAPELASKVQEVVSGFTVAVAKIGFPLSFIPQPIKTLLLFIITTEIALFVIFKSTALTSKLWKVLQKIKLW